MLSYDAIKFRAVGVIHTPFSAPAGIPIQPVGAHGVEGTVEIYPEFSDGLKDIEGFSHIILLFHFSRSSNFELQVSPFLEDDIHGVFAVRAPRRPNQIGMSIVRLLKREENILHIDNPDMLDNTPLLDIKPYIPDFDSYPAAVAGWYEKHREKFKKYRAGDRFKRIG
jgi:tRNA-Thr(GGU) m(6)t(6)A37 methyltransferase TsaA